MKIAFQMPLYPMLDDRDTESSRDYHGISWNTKRNHAAWKKYLANVKGTIPSYAVPARETDYSTFVGNSEAFYCETLEYIDNLNRAGVPARVDAYPSGFHAFDMLLSFHKISKEAVLAFEEQYLYAQEPYFAEQE